MVVPVTLDPRSLIVFCILRVDVARVVCCLLFVVRSLLAVGSLLFVELRCSAFVVAG